PSASVVVWSDVRGMLTVTPKTGAPPCASRTTPVTVACRAEGCCAPAPRAVSSVQHANATEHRRDVRRNDKVRGGLFMSPPRSKGARHFRIALWSATAYGKAFHGDITVRTHIIVKTRHARDRRFATF